MPLDARHILPPMRVVREAGGSALKRKRPTVIDVVPDALAVVPPEPVDEDAPRGQGFPGLYFGIELNLDTLFANLSRPAPPRLPAGKRRKRRR